MDAKNVLGGKLEICCTAPMTGFRRDGMCDTDGTDMGVHVVCARVTESFLSYTKSRGNDLTTPAPHYNFPGLKPGDCWCLCASRWKEALNAGMAPPVILASTHEKTLEYVPLEVLQEYAVEN